MSAAANNSAQGKYTGGTTTDTTSTEVTSSFKNDTAVVDTLTPEQIANLEAVINSTAEQASQTQALNLQAQQELLTQLQNGSILTRDQALADSSGLIEGAARTLAEGDLKTISLQMQGAGASSDALGLLLGNDARARTAEAVGAQQGSLVAQYATAGAQATSGIASSLAALADANSGSSTALAALYATLEGAHKSTTDITTELGASVTQGTTNTNNFAALNPAYGA